STAPPGVGPVFGHMPSRPPGPNRSARLRVIAARLPRALSNHQLHSVQPRGSARVVALQVAHQTLHARSTELGHGDVDCSQPRMDELQYGNVVKSGHGDIFWDAKALPAQLGKSAQRHRFARYEHSAW